MCFNRFGQRSERVGPVGIGDYLGWGNAFPAWELILRLCDRKSPFVRLSWRSLAGLARALRACGLHMSVALLGTRRLGFFGAESSWLHRLALPGSWRIARTRRDRPRSCPTANAGPSYINHALTNMGAPQIPLQNVKRHFTAFHTDTCHAAAGARWRSSGIFRGRKTNKT